MSMPIKLPITSEKSKSGAYLLVGADCELICEMYSATEEEVEFMVTAINAYKPPVPVQEEEHMFVNHYRHCNQEWSDTWSSTCNDRCPVCNHEIEPYASEDLNA